MKIGKRKIWKTYPNKRNEVLENRIKKKKKKRGEDQENRSNNNNNKNNTWEVKKIKTIHGRRRRLDLEIVKAKKNIYVRIE